jgi:glyoxylase-like metal-dependent hydrolase (beta-lactamase superfamily II)
MELTSLGGGVHVLRGAVNSGLVETENGLLAVDTGIDRGAANRIARAAEEMGRPLVAILNTHAHADHHGGNAQLVRRFGIPVYAPAVEEAVIREPRFEPIYLFGGALPVTGLSNKFLQAEPSPVDHVVRPGQTVTIDGRELAVVELPGHSMAQAGVGVGLGTAEGVLFAADSFFGSEPLAKHGVPYLVDAQGMRDSVHRLAGIEAAWFVPGHGDPVDDAHAPVFAENVAALDRAFTWLAERLAHVPASTETLLVEFAGALGMRLDNPSSWVLNRATLLGFLAAMERGGSLRVVMEEGRWLWASRSA